VDSCRKNGGSPFFVDRKDYKNAYYSQLPYHPKKYYIAVNHDTPICPDCGEALTVRDSKKRTVIDSDGNKEIYSLRRLFCSKCSKLHLEIPDCIEPNKHYKRVIIEKVRSGNIEDCPADDRTISRWKK